MSSNPVEEQPHYSRGIYLLPNLFTLTALFFGFYAIIAAVNGQFEKASIGVFIAMVMDMLDGRIARLTHTQTAFGAQLDSLSDMVSFGVAPALIAFSWGLHNLGKAGWLACFVYTAGVALRLARFNSQSATTSVVHDFQGLPSPAGAAFITSLVWNLNEWGLEGSTAKIILAFLSVLISILMVSNLKFHSFKDFDFRNSVSFFVILLIVSLLVLSTFDPPLIWFLASAAYCASAPLALISRLRKREKAKQ